MLNNIIESNTNDGENEWVSEFLEKWSVWVTG